MNHTSSSTGRGGTAYLGKDILGSVRSVTNESGQLEDRYEYDAFGKPYKGDLDNGMNLGYMGKPYDSNTGLYNYGYRDYKPEAARFTTVDPIRDGSNWFVYVNNDPVNYLDLWGLEDVYGYTLIQTGTSKSWTVDSRGGVTENIKSTTYQHDYYSTDIHAISDLHDGQRNGTYSVGQVQRTIEIPPSTFISNIFVMDGNNLPSYITEKLGQGNVVQLSFTDNEFRGIGTMHRNEDGTWGRCSD